MNEVDMDPYAKVRLECLKLATSPGRPLDDVLATADRYEKYVWFGANPPAPAPAPEAPAEAQEGAKPKGKGK